MKTEFQKIVDDVVAHNINCNRLPGNTRIYTPAAYVSDVFAADHRGNDVFSTLQQICDLDQLQEAETYIEDALANAGDSGAEFYADCMRLGEVLVLAIQANIEKRLRDKVQAQLEGKL